MVTGGPAVTLGASRDSAALRGRGQTSATGWRRALSRGAVIGGIGLTVLLGACSRGDEGGTAGSALEGEIAVFAAASLTESFKEIGEAFREANPATEVTFNFAASSALATQINEGAPADVFASADLSQMKVVADEGNVGEAAVFAKNTPVVVVPARGSPVGTFADLAKSDVKLVLAAKDVPIGRYSREILEEASGGGGISADFSTRVLANLKSDEANVRGVLTKVQLGEADAGIVYRTDVAAAAGDVKAIDIPEDYNIVAEYPIATVSDSDNKAAAEAFVAFVRSAEGVAILEKYGFARP